MLQDKLGRVWPEGFSSDDGIVESTEKIPWRWLLLAVFAGLRGASVEGGGEFGLDGLWFLFGLVTLVAFVGEWAVRAGRKRQRHRQSLDDLGPLLQVLREYGVEELGALYLYVPLPERPEDGEVRAWLRVLTAKQVVISGPWRLEACRAPPWLKSTHPGIWSDDVQFYNVYRLKKDPLASFV